MARKLQMTQPTHHQLCRYLLFTSGVPKDPGVSGGYEEKESVFPANLCPALGHPNAQLPRAFDPKPICLLVGFRVQMVHFHIHKSCSTHWPVRIMVQSPCVLVIKTRKGTHNVKWLRQPQALNHPHTALCKAPPKQGTRYVK